MHGCGPLINRIKKMYKIMSIAISSFVDLSPSWNIFQDVHDSEKDEIVLWPMKPSYLVYDDGFCYDLPFSGKHTFVCDDSVLVMDSEWANAVVLTSKSAEHTQLLLLQLFYTHAVRRQMIQLHAATIEDQGRGILFLGPSGIGKTTQAERWAEFRGASIINGDVGFVQRTEREYIAWGTPWHGSSPYCLNASVPVKALVVLKQAPENRLRELTGFEKVSEIAGSVFYPTWLEDGMELCTDTLNHLLTDLPVYRLDNRADRESVEILAKELDRIT